MRVIVWGTGYIAREYIQRKTYHLNDEIICFVDNDRNKWGTKFENLDVISPDMVNEIEFDRILICTVDFYDEIRAQIKNDLKINDEKVITYLELEDKIKDELITRYSGSQDKEIQKILKYYSVYGLNVFGFYSGSGKDIIYPVNFDGENTPYIFFEGKKMFYPKEYAFWNDGNSKYLKNILFEQGKHSPHLYINSENIICDDMVIVDAGVCEGNFALRYVERARKIYLIESDPIWIKALRKTFAPYQDKVVICEKYLADADTDHTVTLDSLVKGKIDILKMDIEGYEVDALRGASKTLTESNAYCAICSYHKHGDEQSVKKLLQQFGYHTSTSEGYMFFPFDSYLEFRRGVVYGRKGLA